MAVVGSAEVLIRPSFKGMGSAAEKAGISAGRRAGTSITSRIGSEVSKWAKRGLFAAGAVTGATLVSGIKAGFEQQATELVLTGLYNDADLARTTMEGLNEVARKSPLGGKAFRSGAESLAYAGVQGDSMIKTLENVGKTIVGAGGTAESMDSFTNALLNGVNRGKFGLNELNQISKSGVPIFSSLAENMGLSMEEVTEFASAGKIGLEDVLDVLENADTDAFQQSMRAGEKAQESFLNTAKTLWNSVTEAIGHHLQPVLEWLTDKFRDLAENVGPKLDSFFEKATKTVKEFVQQWRDGEGPGGKFRESLTNIWEAAKGLWEMFRDNVLPAIQKLVGWLTSSPGLLQAVVGGVLGIVAAWKAYQIGMAAARAITVVFAGAQAALNAVMNLNPIGIVILAITGLVAAFVTAYKRSEKFRAVVDAAWNGIKVAAETVWNFLKKWVFGPLGKAFKTVWTAATTAKDKMNSAWTAVKDAFTYVWNWIDQKVFRPFKVGIEVLKVGFQIQVDKMRDLWEKIKAPFRAVWNWIDEKVLQKFKKGLTNLREHVDKIKEGIGKAWRGIANFFRDPINWVLDKVWNNGIAKAFNSAAKALNLKTRISTEAEIPKFAKGGYHKGGWAIVGEEGPELVNFSNPGRIYTAAETAEALGVERASDVKATDSLPSMGGGIASRAWQGVKDAAGAVTGWVRGGLAKAADLLLSPIRKIIAPTVSQWGTFGKFAGGAMTSSLDSLVKWIRGKDDVGDAGGIQADLAGGKWRRPSRGRVTSRYGPRSLMGMSFHAGTDYAGGPYTYAAGAGKVFRTGWNILSGRSGIGIGIDHGGGVFSYYGHNPSMSAIKVRPGDMVRAGQHIGREGATGNVTGPHLHFEMHRGGWGRHVNPSSFGIFDQGGLLKPGMLAYHSARMSKPDAVLTARQWDDIHRLAAGGGGDTYNVSLEVDIDDVGDVQRLVHTFRELPRRARQRVGVR